MSISRKGLLVAVVISCWEGRKTDKRATEASEKTHNTESGVLRTRKKLLPGSKALEEVVRQGRRVRDFVTKNSLPWAMEGARVIKATEYLPFIQELRKRRLEYESTVGAFLEEYPTLRAQAVNQLGDLFNEKEYPSVERLARKFAIEIHFEPIPTAGDFRVELDAESRADFERQQLEAEAKAKRECWMQLHEVVANAAKTLSKPDARIQDSLVNNILATCDLLGRLNVLEDPELEKSRAEIKEIANKISPDLCRQNSEEREKAAKTFSDLDKLLGAFAAPKEG